jgi:catechol 2,3-dioxygenase-like lactoylglutathione lyase family enzyme
MKIYKISAVTLIVENMEKSCRFYSQIPGFKLVMDLLMVLLLLLRLETKKNMNQKCV